MSFESAQNHTFTATLDCFYRLYAPVDVTSCPLLFVTLHGFGQDPDTILPLTGRMVGQSHVIAAPEGPSLFYMDQKSDRVGHSWVTRKHAASSIRLHHDILLHVLDDAGRNYGIPPE